MIDRRSFIGLGALALCATGSKTLAAASCCAGKKCKKVPFKLGVVSPICFSVVQLLSHV